MKLLFLAAMVLCTCFLTAQNTPIKITIYSNDSSTTTQVKDTVPRAYNGLRNLIKWNYCLMPRGVLMFNYERHLADNFTFECGLGATYSDYVFTSYYEIGHLINNSASTSTTTNSSGTTTNKSLIPNPFENSIKKIGFALELSPRFYFDKDEFQGFYLSPYLSYRKYNYGLSVEEYNYALSTTTYKTFDNLYYSFLDMGAKAGYQYYFPFNDSFYYDFYFGFAYRHANVLTVQKTETQNGFYGNTTTYAEFLQTFGLPQVMLGAKIGYTF